MARKRAARGRVGTPSRPFAWLAHLRVKARCAPRPMLRRPRVRQRIVKSSVLLRSIAPKHDEPPNEKAWTDNVRPT